MYIISQIRKKISLYLWFIDLARSAVTCLKSGFSLCSHFNRENRLCPWNTTVCLSKSLSMLKNTISSHWYTHSNLERKKKYTLILQAYIIKHVHSAVKFWLLIGQNMLINFLLYNSSSDSSSPLPKTFLMSPGSARSEVRSEHGPSGVSMDHGKL